MSDTPEPSKKSGKSLTREFLAERDLRIFKMRQAGVPHAEIARRFSMTTSAVGAAIRRQLEKLNSEAMLAYPEVLRMELERLDSLQQNIWPQTQHRKQTADDGTEVMLEPDLKAVDRVLSIMDRRSRLLGMERNNVSIQMDVTSGGEQIRATLAGAGNVEEKVNQFTPEVEARKLIELMAATGVLSKDVLENLTGNRALAAATDTTERLADDTLAIDLPVDENESENE
ncbi:MAG: hypothetical protein ACO3CH_00280 [Ilumatobacteraceae bacterium]